MSNPNSPSAVRGAVGDLDLRPGDVVVAVNDTEQPVDFRAGLKGWGRLWLCDADLKTKGEWRTGRPGLVIGLMLDATGRFFVSSPQLHELECFDATTTACAVHLPPNRRYGNMTADGRGGVLIGVHSGYGDAEGVGATDGLGDGKLVRFDPETGFAESFDVETDGGRGGKHYVSNLALAPDGRTVFYASEAGRVVKRYDIETRRQLDDFLRVPEGEGGTYGVDVAPDGRVLLATGTGAWLLSPQGETIRRYDSPIVGGWTRAAFCVDPSAFFFSNFVEGVLEKRSVATGEVLAELKTGLGGALTTAVEFAPRGGV